MPDAVLILICFETIDRESTLRHFETWETTLVYVMDSGGLIEDEWPPEPTFDSSLLSRRYSILLCVETGNPYEAKFNLEVPMQIVIHTPKRARTSGLEPWIGEEGARLHSEARCFSEMNSLPSYVR